MERTKKEYQAFCSSWLNIAIKLRLGFIFFLFLLVMFRIDAVSGGPIENLQPGEWYEVPNSHLSAVLPDPLPPGNGPENIIAAWNSGAYDTKRDRLIVWGGGHNDYGGNEVYVFDINTLSWSRIWGPSPNVPPLFTSCNEAYSDGTPCSKHTYDGLEYIPTTDKFWSSGGSKYCATGGGSNATWEFDFNTLSWSRRDDAPDSQLGVVSAYDPITGKVLHQAKKKLSSYDSSTGTFTIIGDGPDFGWQDVMMTAAIDPERRLLVAVGQGFQRMWNLNTMGFTSISTTGDLSIVGDKAPGFEYDPVRKTFVAWSGGADVYILNIDNMEWAKLSPAATNAVVPTQADSHGTFGRFRYIPSKNAYIVVNSIHENVYIYKLSEGGGTTIPPIPDDITPPTISITSPSNGSTVSNSISISANASDDVGVLGVQFKLNGVNFGAEDLSPPYSVTWDTTQNVNNSTHNITAAARDAAGNIGTSASITVTVNNEVISPTPTPTPSGGQIAIPLNTWVAVPSPNTGEGPSPNGQYGGSKHMRLAHNPIDGRIYFLGGDYTGLEIENQSGRQELYSYSIKNNDWILEYPYCGPSGDVQPKHPDEVGWVYDTNRDIFWMVPGQMLSFPPIDCASTLVSGQVMSFSLITKKWTVPDVPELAPPGSENYKFASYDPISDTIIMFYGLGSGGVKILDFKSNSVEDISFSGSIAIGQEYAAIDVEGRVIYVIDSLYGKFYRYNINSKTLDLIGNTPAGTEGSYDVSMPIWDSVNKVVLWPQIPDHGGVITLYVYHPDTNTWENPQMNQPEGILVQGNSAVFDPIQNVLLVMGGIDFSDTLPAPQHLFLYRYGNGNGSEPDTVAPAPPTGLKIK